MRLRVFGGANDTDIGVEVHKRSSAPTAARCEQPLSIVHQVKLLVNLYRFEIQWFDRLITGLRVERALLATSFRGNTLTVSSLGTTRQSHTAAQCHAKLFPPVVASRFPRSHDRNRSTPFATITSTLKLLTLLLSFG